MTVIRLHGDDLLLHSPIRMTPELQRRLESLGTVRHVLAPNPDHYLFVPQCQQAFPEAVFHAGPGVQEKLPDHRFDAVVEHPRGVPEWEPAVEVAYFRSSSSFQEVVLYHRATRTIVSCDLSFNIQSSEGLVSKILLTLNDSYKSFGPSRMCRRLIEDRSMARRDLDAILEWQAERLVVAHGELLEHGATDALRAAYAWLD